MLSQYIKILLLVLILVNSNFIWNVNALFESDELKYHVYIAGPTNKETKKLVCIEKGNKGEEKKG